MKQIKNWTILILTFIMVGLKTYAQPCATAQTLTPLQNSQIGLIISPLDSALKYEDLYHIDSLSTELKNIYSIQGGRPDAIENGYPLVSNVNWLNLSNSILLSRQLIHADSVVYVNLWKVGKGMGPPLYQPHSIFLRSSSEIAVGLLKIADKETDLLRKSLYQSWAIRALDSLATMQLPNGAFPFPDLRTYGDPTFSPIIQGFLNFCGSDSVNVLQNGWIIDDKGTGEFKFDAGVIANSYYEAYQYTGNVNYKNIVIAIGNYLKPLKFNHNFNYNTFVSLGLTRAYQLTNDVTYLDRAIINLRYSVLPGQITNGRWVDGHNANSRYHSIIIQNICSTINLIPSANIYKNALDTMAYKAVKNMMDYSYTCNSTTGYRWLIKSYGLSSSVIPNTLKDSITDLIGKHINQSDTNGKYLDVPTMGDYIELLTSITSLNEYSVLPEIELTVFPNPTNDITHISFNVIESENIVLSLFDINGRLIKVIDEGKKTKGIYNSQINFSQQPSGVYYLNLRTSKGNYNKKIILTR